MEENTWEQIESRDWPRLRACYGTAGHFPQLLDGLWRAPGEEDWEPLWSAVLHQGTSYPASYAVLPWLADFLSRPDQAVFDDADMIVRIGFVLDGDPCGIAGDTSPNAIRRRYAAELDVFRGHALRLVSLPPDPGGFFSGGSFFGYLLRALAVFEGSGWPAVLDGILDGEFSGATCPSCRAAVCFGLDEMAEPQRLGSTAERYHTLALAWDDDLAEGIRRACADARCPQCGATAPLPRYFHPPPHGGAER